MNPVLKKISLVGKGMISSLLTTMVYHLRGLPGKEDWVPEKGKQLPLSMVFGGKYLVKTGFPVLKIDVLHKEVR